MKKQKFSLSTFFEIIIKENICLDDYNVSKDVPILAVYNIFKEEYGHEIKRMGEFRAFEEWLRGLPTCLTIPFYNHDILETAKSHGKIFKTERSEDLFLSRYFREASYNFFILKSRINQVLN